VDELHADGHVEDPMLRHSDGESMVDLDENTGKVEVPKANTPMKKPSLKLRWRDIVRKQVLPTLAVVSEFKLRRTDFER